jgi:hypothetical protein
MENVITIENGFIGALFALIVWAAKQYLVPYLMAGKRLRYAEWIARLADDITDDLIKKHPGNDWISFANDAVDKLMDICGIEKEVADRAVNASIERKKRTAVDA